MNKDYQIQKKKIREIELALEHSKFELEIKESEHSLQMDQIKSQYEERKNNA